MDYKDDLESLHYLTACRTQHGNTSIVLTERPCNSSKVPKTPLCSFRVAQSETAINSFPLGSPGRLYGLTLRKLFDDFFHDPSDMLFFPAGMSWWLAAVLSVPLPSPAALSSTSSHYRPGDRPRALQHLH